MKNCLNPYCIGWYSLGLGIKTYKEHEKVLILIVLDGILWEPRSEYHCLSGGVLILIVLDGILWALETSSICSECKVLILIVLDGILWE